MVHVILVKQVAWVQDKKKHCCWGSFPCSKWNFSVYCLFSNLIDRILLTLVSICPDVQFSDFHTRSYTNMIVLLPLKFCVENPSIIKEIKNALEISMNPKDFNGTDNKNSITYYLRNIWKFELNFLFFFYFVTLSCMHSNSVMKMLLCILLFVYSEKFCCLKMVLNILLKTPIVEMSDSCK